MLPRRMLQRVTAVAVAVGLALSLSAPAQAAGPRYAALGDSYASGWGAGAGIPSVDRFGHECGRSANAYGRLWAEQHRAASFKNITCKGHTADWVGRYQTEAMPPDTTMVTVTAGGNDVNFSNTIASCRLDTRQVCLNNIAGSVREMGSYMPGRLDYMYDRISSRLTANGAAKVYVLGYPRLFTETNNCGLFSIPNDVRHQLNLAAETMNTQQKAAVARANRDHPEKFVYVDVRDRFAQHGVCSSNGAWILPAIGALSDVRNLINNDFNNSKASTSYHPTDVGHRNGYLPALNAFTG